jgi:hypothetical protein
VPLVATMSHLLPNLVLDCQVMCCDLTCIVCIRSARFSGGCGGLTLNVLKVWLMSSPCMAYVKPAYVKPMYMFVILTGKIIGLCQAWLFNMFNNLNLCF